MEFTKLLNALDAAELCEQVVSETTQALFTKCFLFGFHAKEAGVAEENTAFVEYAEAVNLVFEDFTRDWLFSEDEDSDIKMINKYSIAYNQEDIFNEAESMRFFAPSEEYAPANITELKTFLKDNLFCYPQMIWFKKTLVWQRFCINDIDIIRDCSEETCRIFCMAYYSISLLCQIGSKL